MIRARWKALFCSEECRNKDKYAVRSARAAYRWSHGLALLVAGKCAQRAKVREQMRLWFLLSFKVSEKCCIAENRAKMVVRLVAF
jgi:hypothetical protein